MPFTKQERRAPMLAGELKDIEPGDRCQEKYQQIMDAWDNEPRWKTVDLLAKRFLPDEDVRAFFLAFLVFFAIHAMPYEEKMRAKNGDIRGRRWNELLGRGLPRRTLWQRIKDLFIA